MGKGNGVVLPESGLSSDNVLEGVVGREVNARVGRSRVDACRHVFRQSTQRDNDQSHVEAGGSNGGHCEAHGFASASAEDEKCRHALNIQLDGALLLLAREGGVPQRVKHCKHIATLVNYDRRGSHFC